MKFILDMVHHNPGEPPFKSRFLDPAHLADYGFNGQVFKHINCIATFAASGVDCFPAGSPDRAWLDKITPGIEREIAAAKQQGLKVFYHVDLFVLPRRLVEHFKNEICDPQTGRILLDKPKTLELHRILFNELTARFPQVDGYIIRVGETYLFDTPYHVGNGPIPRIGPAWTPNYLYAETLASQPPAGPRWTKAQADAYVKLIRFLRQEICVQHGKQLFFRTWDIFPDKLHARLDHYLEVSDQIEPHPLLAFSIKHTALDFWRHVKVNECLTQGQHPQIIEVQCQREYEGKGAYPNYVMDGIINGFEENAKKIGLKDLVGHPKILGVYSWSRGGGWYGPYIQNELWPDLNAFVLAQFVKDSSRSEAQIFLEYATGRLGLDNGDVNHFRELCVLSAKAVLKGRHCAVFDRVLRESVLPTACWMRDDRLGGREQLAEVLNYLGDHDLYGEALAEKSEAVRLWQKINLLANQIHWPDHTNGEFAKVSAQYGLRLFRVVEQGWRVLIAQHRAETSGQLDGVEIDQALAAYDEAWSDYRALASVPQCPSLYAGKYFNLPGTSLVEGLEHSVEHCRKHLLVSASKPETQFGEPYDGEPHV
ncbi:MAG: hypothetical protein WCH99_15950 [Verrucomicrobiota bacterium]